ncbi:hypothetical protein [Sphingobium sp.]|uniref:hypothetical protein n=1 Tax=Sphingobium sp. TaxID=1912891 RepID=UPI001A2DA27E|nr:hypothetical protein [Sphingobium sp.]MBJ7376345.1 hypothetical protein [Sphingobium sp.]
MLTIVLLLLAGFIVGVALTAMFALLYIGVIHAEAVRIVDTHLAGITMPPVGPVITIRQTA